MDLPSGWIFIPKVTRKGTAIEVTQRELITCKDCKFFARNIRCVGGHYDGCSQWLFDGNEAEVEENEFCSRAKRREDALEQSEI